MRRIAGLVERVDIGTDALKERMARAVTERRRKTQRAESSLKI
jgi:hypothetical protein